MINRLLAFFLTCSIVSSAALSTPAFADHEMTGPFDKERFQIRARAIGVLPEGGGDTTIDGSPDADDAIVPELDISYFIDHHWAMELILGTSPHDLALKNRPGGARDLDLGDTMILPPTVTLQYHFTLDNRFSPYLGAGINYTLPYAEDNGADALALEADGSFGYALQAGTDFWLNDHWGLNLDVKKIWVDVDASINNGAITGEVELDPLVVGAGVSYRF